MEKLGVRFRWKLVILIGVGSLLLGSWPVTGPVRFFLGRVEKESGWHLSVTRAQWVPWREIQLMDVKLQVPQGGLLHVREIQIRPRLISLLRGSLSTTWIFGELRMDPASWGIHKPLAQEMISSTPLATDAQAEVLVGTQRMTLERLSLQGPWVRLQAEGWVNRARESYIKMEGALARQLLEGMKLLEPDAQPVNPWEPFQMQMKNDPIHPELLFSSRFFSLQLKSHGEH